MDDLISREGLLNDLSYCAPELWQDEGYIKAKIMKQPTVDAVPVVRCKDCKMWNTEWNHEAGDCYCYKFFQWTDPDFFCADGERREVDNG